MGERPLPYGRQTIEDDDVAAVVSTLEGDWLTQGPKVAEFEERLAETTGARYAVAVANGTAALHLAALAAGVRAGSTGITSTITFVASANCIRYAGGAPFFCDVDADTGLLDLASLRSRVDELVKSGRAPRVIIPVDMTGAVPDLEATRAIAESVGAVVIEDAAHSLGSTYGGGHRAASCVHSHMAILSFHPVKHVTTGEGGAITTNDEALYRELRDLRTHGITKDASKLTRDDGPWYYEQHALGFNYRITDMQCALGISQLAKLGRFVDRRRELAAIYDAEFASSTNDIRPLRVPPGCRSAHHLYVVRVVARPGETLASIGARRRALFIQLRERNIFAQVHYIPVHTQPDYVRNGLGEGSFPGADAYYASVISLPLFPGMRDEDARRVAREVRSAIREGEP